MIKRLLRQNKTTQSSPKPLPAGNKAPDFILTSDSGEEIALKEFRGRPVVLVFYPEDNSSVCSNQLALYNEAYHLFEEHDAQLLGISVDDQASHKEFAESLNLRFPLLADDDPTGEIARAYGVYDENDQVAERALFVLDADGDINWRYVAPRGVNPGAHGILDALESMNKDN